MPVLRTRVKRRESDVQRVGERFGKVMRVVLVGCRQKGEQFGKGRSRVEKAGEVKRHRAENTLRGKDPEGENLGLEEPV